jgi:MinD-like ATPase involved in chromosome partitioning or flagellar assembly/DNA-binding response OmpR family regulator
VVEFTKAIALPNSPNNGTPKMKTSQVQHTLMAYLRHELCTPIDAMMGYSTMLLEELQTQPESILVADLHKIHTCSQQLLTLVSTILDPVQLEMSQIDGELSRFGAELRMELLTPISTIVGYCEMLLEEAPAELIPDLDKIHTAAHQLLSLVNDIVQLAQQQLQRLTVPDASSRLVLEHPATAILLRSATTTLETIDRESTLPQAQGGMILVVDDNPTNCDLLSRQLKRQGYTVTTATNAHQALRLLKAIAYDLILLDAIMPEIDGLELLQQLKQDDRFKHIPAIVISALETIDVAVKCIELGAEDYLQKPCDPILLHARITTSLEKKRLRDREILYRQQVEHLTTAATAIETKTFNPNSLDDLSQQPHQLGQLARVFQQMARSIDSREQVLEQQIQRLQSGIDFRSVREASASAERLRQRGQKQRLVAEITATEHFQQLQHRTKRSSDIENLYRSSLYPSLHPTPPNRDRIVASTVASPLAVVKRVAQPEIDPQQVTTSNTIAVHSFRGGTGKSNLVSNLAVSLAKQGKRVGIIDTDLQSPGIHVLFGLDDETIDLTLNDYLWHRCALYEAAYDLSHLAEGNSDGAIYLIPASAKANDITRIVREGYAPDLLLDGCSQIVRDLQLDFLLIDTHPGINEETLQALAEPLPWRIAICSQLIVMLRPDYQDYQGTAAIVELARMLSVADLLLVIDRVPPSFDVETYKQQVQTAYGVPVAAVLPFAEEMIDLASSQVFAVRYPTHPLTQAIDRLAHILLQHRDTSKSIDLRVPMKGTPTG